MVDRRPFSSNESEEKEDTNNIEESIFPIYSARSQHDMSAMVCVLSQVIGNTTTNISSSVHGINPLTLPQSAAATTNLQNQIQERAALRFKGNKAKLNFPERVQSENTQFAYHQQLLDHQQHYFSTMSNNNNIQPNLFQQHFPNVHDYAQLLRGGSTNNIDDMMNFGGSEPCFDHQQSSSSSGGNFVSPNMSLELQQQQPSYYDNKEEDFLRFQMDFGNSSTSTGPPSESNWKDFEPRK
ncbi:hypothetical protein K7X08_000243 [Anisodus acutangulus]|uniref:Uncharacterized protein n=1 Tax=Anisodus acutangulus TaxID=402998 RepID=A0A9Q1M6M1_9SOLA|nr:hypothetical protein K7X08_000243 [Anisodus acutangulus]